MFAGRRSGKTTLVQHEMIEAATENPDCAVVFLGPTIGLAVKTVWSELREWSRPYGGVPYENTHEIRFDNRACIYVLGSENKKTIDKVRGIKRIVYAAWDEQQNYNSEFAIYALSSVLYPSLADEEGRLVLMGTGGPEFGHWFELVTKGRLGELSEDPTQRDFVVTSYPWTMWNNPYIGRRADRELAKVCRLRGVPPSDPYVRREYGSKEKGIEFTTDSTLSVFGLIGTRHVDLLPGGRIVLGGDVGSVDLSACSAKWIHPNYRGIVTLESEARKTPAATDQIAFFREKLDFYSKISSEKVLLALDPGGGGKAVAEDLKKLQALAEFGDFWDPLAAEKFDKAFNLRLMADDVRSGFMTYEPDKCKAATDGLQKLEWDPKAVGQKLKGHAPDPADADLYGWRLAKSLYRYEEPSDEIPHDPSLDFLDAEDEMMREAGMF